MTTYCLRTHWGWVVTFAAFIQNAATFGMLYSYSILFLSFQQEFKTGATLTGWVGSLANSLACLLTPLSTTVLHRISCRTGAILGIITFSVGLICTSFATELWYTFLTFGVLVGFGANLCTTSVFTLVGKWFPDKYYCRATAFIVMGTSTGLVCVNIVLTSLISKNGWRVSLRLLSATFIFIGILAAWPMKNPGPLSKQANNDSKREERDTNETLLTEQPGRGQPADRKCAMETRLCDMKKPVDGDAVEARLVKAECSKERLKSGLDDERVGWFKVLGMGDIWLWCIGVTLANNAYTFAVINLASFMHELEFTKGDTTLVISMFAAAEWCGKLILAAIGDHLPFPLLYTVVASSLVAAIVPGLMIIAKTLPTLVMCSIVFGLMRSGLCATSYATPNQLFGHLGISVVNMMAMIPYGIGILIAAPISGGLYDMTGNYNLSLIVIIGCFVTSVASFLLIPLVRRFRSRDSSSVPSSDGEDK